MEKDAKEKIAESFEKDKLNKLIQQIIPSASGEDVVKDLSELYIDELGKFASLLSDSAESRSEKEAAHELEGDCCVCFEYVHACVLINFALMFTQLVS